MIYYFIIDMIMIILDHAIDAHSGDICQINSTMCQFTVMGGYDAVAVR